MKIKFRILSLIVPYLLSFCLFSCGSDDGVIEPGNRSPVVDTFVVPTEFSPGEVIEFSVIAYDTDGDPLTFTWEADAGELSETIGTTVEWAAPEDAASVAVTVLVSDGISRATRRTKSIKNKELSLIVPGKGAAGIKLGDPFKNVEKLYGEPDNPLGVNRQFSYRKLNIGLSGFVDDENLVSDIFVARPNKAKTVGGNGIGSSLKHVEGELGNAEQINDDLHLHWYWKKGISFEYDVDNKVTSIHIFNPH